MIENFFPNLGILLMQQKQGLSNSWNPRRSREYELDWCSKYNLSKITYYTEVCEPFKGPWMGIKPPKGKCHLEIHTGCSGGGPLNALNVKETKAEPNSQGMPKRKVCLKYNKTKVIGKHKECIPLPGEPFAKIKWQCKWVNDYECLVWDLPSLKGYL